MNGPSTSSDNEALVRAKLSLANVPASEEEIAMVVAGYDGLKAMIASLHAVDEARYEAPGLHFDPCPVFTDWA